MNGLLVTLYLFFYVHLSVSLLHNYPSVPPIYLIKGVALYNSIHCPVCLTAQSASHLCPVHSNMNSTSLERIQPLCNYCKQNIQSHISTTVYVLRNSFTGWDFVERTGLPRLRNRGKEESNPTFLDWESDILPLSLGICHISLFRVNIPPDPWASWDCLLSSCSFGSQFVYDKFFRYTCSLEKLSPWHSTLFTNRIVCCVHSA